MSDQLRAALANLAQTCAAARVAPQEFFIRGATRAERRQNDPRYNETAGARVAADKQVVHAARVVTHLFNEGNRNGTH